MINISNWSRENLAWLAGILEGEGSFYWESYKNNKTSKRYPRITVQMSDADVLQKAALIGGCGVFGGPTNNPNGHKPIYSWKVCVNHHVYALLVALFPFMGQRRQSKMRELIEVFRTETYRLSYK